MHVVENINTYIGDYTTFNCFLRILHGPWPIPTEDKEFRHRHKGPLGHKLWLPAFDHQCRVAFPAIHAYPASFRSSAHRPV